MNNILSETRLERIRDKRWDIFDAMRLPGELRKHVRKIRGVDNLYQMYKIIHFLPNVVELQFSDWFNSPIDELPKKVTQITFGSRFNQPISDLVGSLTHLTLGMRFDQPLDLTDTKVEHVVFPWGSSFNQSIKLPKTLVSLKLGEDFQHKFDLSHAENLKLVVIDEKYEFRVLCSWLPPGFTGLYDWVGYQLKITCSCN
jgi:hypothetical protein